MVNFLQSQSLRAPTPMCKNISLCSPLMNNSVAMCSNNFYEWLNNLLGLLINVFISLISSCMCSSRFLVLLINAFSKPLIHRWHIGRSWHHRRRWHLGIFQQINICDGFKINGSWYCCTRGGGMPDKGFQWSIPSLVMSSNITHKFASLWSPFFWKLPQPRRSCKPLQKKY